MTNAAHQHLCYVSDRTNQKLAQLIRQNGQIHFPERHKTLADHLCHSIVSQQLSKQAATAIMNRIKMGYNVPEFSFSELNNLEDMTVLKASGVSQNKIKAIKAVLECKAELERAEFLDSSAVIAELTKIWGVGVWTAQMTALFYCRFEDIWSWNDAALKRGIACVLPEENQHEPFVEEFSPYRSFLSLHIWRAIDTSLIK